ncbi:hypothetical protein CKO36_07680 [Rhabdochromatium marinum]|nr:hypothetical protein [Rhabdochromatium marinum]
MATWFADRPRIRLLYWIALALLSAAIAGQTAVMLGADTNWDLRNYHLYNPFAVLKHRLSVDHNAAGVQTHINPTLDLILTYPAYTLGSPRFATRMMGAVQGLNLVLILAIIFSVAGTSRPISFKFLLFALSAAMLGMSGALTVSELGTSFGDLTTAVVVLAGLLFALIAFTEDRHVPEVHLLALAGLLVGGAAGLKLTNGIYLVGLGAATIFVSGRTWLRTGLAFGGGAVIGLLATHGWWSWYLWQETGNPVFPFFNSIFGSPLFPDIDFSDGRFFPKDWWQSLFYPFWFSWNSQTAEVSFRDFRFPIAYVLAIALLIKFAARRFAIVSTDSAPPQRRLLLFTFFLVITYILWQIMFSIQRYAIGVEVVLPAFVLVAAVVLMGRFGWGFFAAAAVLLIFSTKVPDWGRIHNEHEISLLVTQQIVAEFSPLLDDAVVVMGQPPIAYVATAFHNARSTTWLGPTLTETDRKEAFRKASGRKRVLALRREGMEEGEYIAQRLRELSLPLSDSDSGSCRDLRTTLETLVLCEIGTIMPKPAR